MGRFSTGSYQEMKHGVFCMICNNQPPENHHHCQDRRNRNRTGQNAIPELLFNSSGTVHMEFIPEGATVNKHCYKEILRCLCSSFHRKCPELCHRKNWLLLHDSTPAHRSVLVQEELAKQVSVLPHPPYSLDLTVCNLFFFPHLKEKLHGC
jgi:hypothetical protein